MATTCASSQLSSRCWPRSRTPSCSAFPRLWAPLALWVCSSHRRWFACSHHSRHSVLGGVLNASSEPVQPRGCNGFVACSNHGASLLCRSLNGHRGAAPARPLVCAAQPTPLLAPPGMLARRHPVWSKPWLHQRACDALRVSWGRPFLVGQGWSRAWPSSAAHQSPPLSSASLASLASLVVRLVLLGLLVLPLPPPAQVSAGPEALARPVLAMEAPNALDVEPDSDDDWNALLDAHGIATPATTAQQQPSLSRPTPLELDGAPATSAVAARASQPSVPCGVRSERPFFACNSQFVARDISLSWSQKKYLYGLLHTNIFIFREMCQCVYQHVSSCKTSVLRHEKW